MSHDMHQAVYIEGPSPNEARYLQGPHQVTIVAGHKLSLLGKQIGPSVTESKVALLLGSKVPQQQQRLLLSVQGEEFGLREALLNGFAQFLLGICLFLLWDISDSMDSKG